VVTLTCPDGNVTNRFEYDAFGIPVTCNLSPVTRFIGFSSKEFDPRSGLSYYGFRYYDAASGRWLTKDPSLWAADMALYRALYNNQENYCEYYGSSSLLGGFITRKAAQLVAQEAEDRWNSLNNREKQWVKDNGWRDIGTTFAAGYNVYFASSYAATWGGAWGIKEDADHLDTEIDAMRHCIRACADTVDLGLLRAQLLASMHEEGETKPTDPIELAIYNMRASMDNDNNDVGFKIGSTLGNNNGDSSQCPDCCEEAWKARKLTVLNPQIAVPVPHRQ
jgi:RHS repeat-associated protein